MLKPNSITIFSTGNHKANDGEVTNDQSSSVASTLERPLQDINQNTINHQQRANNQPQAL
ncbi:hypothetical protein ACVNPX_00200 [Staphylococcus aureus]